MKEYRPYLIHAAIQNFTEVAFISFGSLLIYLKTGSVMKTLIFILMMKFVAVIFKSIFVRPYLSLVRHIGAIKIMIASLFLWGASLASLFLVTADSRAGIVAFFATGIVYAVAHSGYWICSNALGFSFVGLSKTPGRYSSYWQIALILSGILSALAGLFLNLGGDFLRLLLFMGLLLVASIVPLHYVSNPKVTVMSFKECIKKISFQGLLANINPEYTMINVSVPLIILFSFGSLSKSIGISVAVSVVTMVMVYLMGKSKDRRDNKFVVLSTVITLGGLVYYGFASSPLGFVIAGIIVGVSISMIDTSREACVGRELTNNCDPMAGALAVEFGRSLGGFLGVFILIIAYMITGSLWQPILALGAITILPKIFYATKNIQSPRDASELRRVNSA